MLKEHSNYEMAVHASGKKTKDKKTEQKKKTTTKRKGNWTTFYKQQRRHLTPLVSTSGVTA